MLEELREINVSEISVNPSQPRRHFAQAELEELAASIRAVGIIHPPVVQPDVSGNGFELISGERRFRAAQLAGFTKITVMVRNRNHCLSAQAALIENIQRVDLNPIEIAKALRNLSQEFKLNQEELALRVGKKRSTVANYLRLLTLPLDIQNSVGSGEISMGHAKAILALEDLQEQIALHQRVLRDNLTVRQTEAAVNYGIKKESKPAQERDCHLESFGNLIQQKLGTKVTIQGDSQRGRIQIEYYDLDDLDRIMTILQINESL
jgi:ParB family transcriptional regulator, chromosome partitioning protein